MVQNKGFFASLFDFSFTELVTTKIIKVIYILVVVFAGLGAISSMSLIFSYKSIGLFSLILPPFGFLLIVTFTRVFLEAMVALHRIQEHAAEIAEQGRKETTNR